MSTGWHMEYKIRNLLKRAGFYDSYKQLSNTASQGIT